MGVSGCGKTTIGKLLANHMQVPFFDADDFHPPSNVKKMRLGTALNDDDRKPWLEDLSSRISEWNESDGAVLACSALKDHYRSLLKKSTDNKINQISFIYLKGSRELIHKRLLNRDDHYMPPELLESQFNDLEEPEDSITVDIGQEPEMILKEILMKLR